MEMRERLRVARKERGLTLVEVGERIGYSHSTISNVETGEDEPGRKLLGKLIKLYGIRPQWLHRGEGPKFSTEEEIEEQKVKSRNRTLAISRIESGFADAGRTVTLDDPEGGERRVFSFAEATDEEWQYVTAQVLAVHRGLGKTQK